MLYVFYVLFHLTLILEEKLYLRDCLLDTL